MLSKILPVIAITVLLFSNINSAGSASSGVPKSGGEPAAAIVGHIRFEGQPPKPMPINMSADPSCLKQHAGATSERVVAGTDGGLENVIVFIQSGLGDRTFDAPADAVVIDQKGCMYRPHVVALRTNQKLRVTNSDPVSHNIHPTPANNREWNKAQPPGSTIEESFAREEIAIPIKCNVHPWMRSYVAVFKHPFFAVTAEDGSFTLHDVPPGEYVIAAWHEKLGTQTQKVTIGAGESKTLDFVFKSGH
jgi:plastocyanin